jgi:hypothetical protein
MLLYEMALYNKLRDIKKVKMANACCIRGPLICFAIAPPSSIPIMAPPANGRPIDQFR